MSRLDERVRKRLRRLREIQHLTQEEVAGRLGWHQTRLSKYEKGAVLEIDDVDQLARVYGTTLEELLSGAKVPKQDKDLNILRSLYTRLDNRDRATFLRLMEGLASLPTNR